MKGEGECGYGYGDGLKEAGVSEGEWMNIGI
jgi:hypothetical protein